MRLRASISLYLFCAAAYLLLKSNSLLAVDGICRFQLTRSLVEGVTLTSECPFAPAQSILQVPLYLIGGVIEKVGWVGEGAPLREFCVGIFNSLLTPLTALALFHVSGRLGFGPRVGLGLALLFAFGTSAFHYARFNGNEPLLSLLLVGLFYFLLRLGEKVSWGNLLGVAFVLSLLIMDNYGMIPLALLTLGVVLCRRIDLKLGGRHILFISVMMAAAFLFCLYYNLARFGSIGATGYYWLSFSPPWVGIYAFLLSPGRSVLLYNPLIIPGLFGMKYFLKGRKDKWSLYFVVVVPLYFLILHASLPAWWGGLVWGPRYLVPVLPFLIIPLGTVLERYSSLPSSQKTVFLLFAAVSFSVQLLSVVVHYKYYWLTLPLERGGEYYGRFFSFTRGPFLGQIKLLFRIFLRPEYFDFFWFHQFRAHPLEAGGAVAVLASVMLISLFSLKKSFSEV